MNRYPIYIISKGRWESRLTQKALEKINANYKIVIELQEYDQYAKVIDPKKILILPFSNLGQGSIPARNWVWEHSISGGFAKHWILDDNISHFFRLHKNIKYRLTDTVGFEVIEDFTDRYINMPMAGMQYELFAPAKEQHPPIIWNTRIYSCILIDNKFSERWRGKYNEDTDLSLRFLKKGLCTALFYVFLCKKVQTMTMKGGNTDLLYKEDDQFDGRLEMAKSLQKQHPDVCKITWKYRRWQHQVDYRPFKKNKPVKKSGISITPGINEYGMNLIDQT